MEISVEHQDRRFDGLEYLTDHSAIRIQYVFASAAERGDSGRYTCSSTAHPNQTALVTVLGNSIPGVNSVPWLVALLCFLYGRSMHAGVQHVFVVISQEKSCLHLLAA